MGDSYSPSSHSTVAAQPRKPQPVPLDTNHKKSDDIDHDRLKSLEQVRSPPSPNVDIEHMMFRRQTSLDLDDYFTGPRDIAKHSKWPLIMQMHGSITPKLIVPLLIVGGWSSLITCISMLKHSLKVESVLLTILGFVVGLSLSFRSSTAYERYAEGRRYWGQITLASQALGRIFWIHADNIAGQDPRELTIKKISAMNLVVAFAISLKHALRFEPYTAYPDIQHMVGHLNTFAQAATEHIGTNKPKPKNFFKSTGEYLGVSFATSNPRKLLKKSQYNLGNLPLEILNHLSITLDRMCDNGQFNIPMQVTIAFNNIQFLNDAAVGCTRVLNTPLPIAYTIAITQITWLYVILLPFQLVGPLEWIAIPATIAAAYIIFGLLFIGQEIENPFGMDVNDLPLDSFCDQIAHDMDVIASHDKSDPDAVLLSNKNLPLYPVSMASAADWMKRSDDKLHDAIRQKPQTMFKWRLAQFEKDEQNEKSFLTKKSAAVTPGDHNV